VLGIGFLVASATAVAIFCYKERKKERGKYLQLNWRNKSTVRC